MFSLFQHIPFKMGYRAALEIEHVSHGRKPKCDWSKGDVLCPNKFQFLMHLMLPIPAYQQCHIERKEGFPRLSLISCDTEVIHELITPLSYYPQSSTSLAFPLTYFSYVG
jgi:hypothetical protein